MMSDIIALISWNNDLSPFHSTCWDRNTRHANSPSNFTCHWVEKGRECVRVSVCWGRGIVIIYNFNYSNKNASVKIIKIIIKLLQNDFQSDKCSWNFCLVFRRSCRHKNEIIGTSKAVESKALKSPATSSTLKADQMERNIISICKLKINMNGTIFRNIARSNKYLDLNNQDYKISVSFNYTEKKDLIESKKIICLNDFLRFKEMICLNETKFVWFKQNIFGPNKYLFESNKFPP